MIASMILCISGATCVVEFQRIARALELVDKFLCRAVKIDFLLARGKLRESLGNLHCSIEERWRTKVDSRR